MGTVMLHSREAIALGLELVSHGHIIESGVAKDLPEKAQALVFKRIRQLQKELQDLALCWAIDKRQEAIEEVES